jgi:hypothetical protein
VSPAHAQKRDRNVLLPDEIAEKKDVTNAYEAIQRFRSPWLRTSRSRTGLGASGGSEGYRYKNQKPGAEGTSSSSSSSTDPSTPSSGYDPTAADKLMTGPILYVDDVKQDQLDELKNIRVAEIAEIRFMTGTEASGRYGAGHEGGAILLKTNRLKH